MSYQVKVLQGPRSVEVAPNWEGTYIKFLFELEIEPDPKSSRIFDSNLMVKWIENIKAICVLISKWSGLNVEYHECAFPSTPQTIARDFDLGRSYMWVELKFTSDSEETLTYEDVMAELRLTENSVHEGEFLLWGATSKAVQHYLMDLMKRREARAKREGPIS